MQFFTEPFVHVQPLFASKLVLVVQRRLLEHAPAALLVHDGEVCPPQLVDVVVVLVLAPARGLGLAACVVIITRREADGTHFLGGRSIIM